MVFLSPKKPKAPIFGNNQIFLFFIYKILSIVIASRVQTKVPLLFYSEGRSVTYQSISVARTYCAPQDDYKCTARRSYKILGSTTQVHGMRMPKNCIRVSMNFQGSNRVFKQIFLDYVLIFQNKYTAKFQSENSYFLYNTLKSKRGK